MENLDLSPKSFANFSLDSLDTSCWQLPVSGEGVLEKRLLKHTDLLILIG